MKIMVLFAAVFLVAGMLALIRGLRDVGQARRSVAWPTVEATVVVSRVVRGGKGTTRPEVTFRYAVAEVAYEAKTVYFGQGIAISGGGHTARVLGRYPLGARVQAHYAPEDPALAVLEPGFSRASLSFVALGYLLLTFGSGMIFLDWTTPP